MATLYITECNALGFSINAGQLVQAPFMPPVAEQHITITTTSTTSTTWSSTTRFLMVETDATCSLAWSNTSASVTATTSAHRVAAGETRFYTVNPGGLLAVVTNT